MKIDLQFHKPPFLSWQGFTLGPVLFLLFINNAFPFLLSINCSLCDCNLVFLHLCTSAMEATQESVVRLKRSFQHCCLSFNPGKCKASFLVNLHEAKSSAQSLSLLNSPLRFKLTSAYFGATFDCTVTLCKRKSSLKAFFPALWS